MSYSKNQKAAKDFLLWVHSKEIYEQWFASQQGYCGGATKDWERDPVWNLDPALLPFRDVPYEARLPGYSGPPGLGRSDHQIYHHPNVCEGRARHAGRRRREMGP